MKMNLPTRSERRPEPPTIAALPEYTNVHEVVTRLTDERDEAVNERNDFAELANRRMCKLEKAEAERDDLSARSLPFLSSPAWPPTDHPVDAVCFDELVEKLDFMPGLRTDGDDTDFAGQIAAFGREYAGWE